MAHIHYKFASKRSSDTVIFDGPHITLKDLKRLIMEKEKLRSGDCDLQITNAQTKEEFTDDEGLIAKGSSVVVRRIPVVGARSSSNAKIRNFERSDGHLPQSFGAVRAMGAQSSSSTLPLFSKMTNLAFVDASEEDKLKVLVNQSLYDSMSYNMKAGPGLPANYSCFRCGSTGHHIRNCPNSGQDKTTEAPLRIKKSTGIPRSFMVEVDDPSIKGAMLTNCGHYAIPAIHAKAYAVGKKEKPPFVPQELPVSKDKDPVPKELLCLICKEMLSDAVVIPCCGNSFCDDCIRTALLDSDQHTCPTCKQSNVSPDTLIANKFLRQAVNTFQKEQGQSKSLTGNDGTSQPVNPAWAPDPVLKKKPHQSAHKQQTQSTAQGRLVPPLTTGPAPPPTVTSISLKPLQTQTNTFKNEPEEQTCDEPSEEGSVTDAAAAAAAAAAAVSESTSEEKPQIVSITPQQSATDPVPGPVWPPTYWESISSSSSCPPFSSSSAYPSVPPPLFPSPHFPSFLTAQHHHTSYPPGYQAATPIWSIHPPQGPPIPPLCSSTHDWYKHQREKNETRSPHRGSTHRRSASRSKSSKSSRSYSRSSSRSRSRSRSVSRSRHHSPYSRSRHLHTRSHSSYTNSYGYKRSPTPSSSSSPRLSHHSRSKSPSDHRKKSHHSRHHSKKSSSGRGSSGRSGERGQEGRGPEESHSYDQRAKPNSSVELDRQRYLQWKREYKEWCDKYLNSYVSHFHQMPPLLNLPLSPRLWEDTEGNGCSSRMDVESRSHRHRSRSTTHTNDLSTPSRSSSDCCSTASQSSIDSRSSPSQSSNHSRSPASHLSSDGYSTPSKLRAGHHTEDDRKDARRRPRSSKDDTPGLKKSSPREPSQSVQPLVKASKHFTFKRERREHNSDKEKNQATKGAGKIHSGNSKTDPRSEKPGKRKGDDAKTLAEARSSKCLKTSTTEVCKSESQHPSDKKGSEKEKKSGPVSERDIWEEGMKVKPQKRISINISLDGRKTEEKNGQSQTICLESFTGKPGEDVQKSDNGEEEKVNEVEFSGELGGEAKEDINPDEREQRPIWKEDVSDHQDQLTEEREKKEGWHCIFRHHEEEEEEESKGLQEEHEGMKASTNKEVITREGKSTKSEGRSGGQERREFITGEKASTETESRVEVKLRMETKEDRTRSMSEEDRAEREESDRHGSHGNGLERMLMVGAPQEYTQDRASEGEGRVRRVPGSKWEKEESEKKEQDEEFEAESSLWSVSKMEKSTVSSSHCGTAPPSGKDRFYSSSSRRDWKRETEMESDRTRQKEKEAKRSQERRKKEENYRDREEEQRKRNLRADQGKIQENQLHQGYDSLPAPSLKCKEKAAGNHQSPHPLPPHCWGEEKGLLPSEGIKKSENDITIEKKVWMEKSKDNVIKVCRLQGDGVKRHFEEEKKGVQWRDVTGTSRREQEEGGRPSSSSASQESSSEHSRNERMKQMKHRKEKREAEHELLEEWEKDKKSKKSRDGKEY